MEGKCLCGAITVRTPDKKSVDACHCGMCRRWGGGPALGVACGSNVQIDGADKLKVYKYLSKIADKNVKSDKFLKLV